MLIPRTLDRLGEWTLTSANPLPQDLERVRVVPVEASLRLVLWPVAATRAPWLRRPNLVPQRRHGLPGYNRVRSGYPREPCPCKNRHRVRRAQRVEHTRPQSSVLRTPTGHVRQRGWQPRGTLLGPYHPYCNPRLHNRWLDPLNHDRRTGVRLVSSKRNDCWSPSLSTARVRLPPYLSLRGKRRSNCRRRRWRWPRRSPSLLSSFEPSEHR